MRGSASKVQGALVEVFTFAGGRDRSVALGPILAKRSEMSDAVVKVVQLWRTGVVTMLPLMGYLYCSN